MDTGGEGNAYVFTLTMNKLPNNNTTHWNGDVEIVFWSGMK
jgi:hypothetical protein